jgi:hypothetical protein
MSTPPKIHATTTTVGAAKTATITNIEAMPNAVKHTTFGDSEAKAALALCRRLVEQGYDPDTKLDIPVLNPLHPIVTIGHFV